MAIQREFQPGDIVSAGDFGHGTVLAKVDEDTYLVDFEDAPHPVDVCAEDLEPTDIPSGYGKPSRALDHIEDWW